MADRSPYSPAISGTRRPEGSPYYDTNGLSGPEDSNAIPAEMPLMQHLDNIQPDLEAHVSQEAWDQNIHQQLAQSVMDMTRQQSNHYPHIVQMSSQASHDAVNHANHAAAAAAVAAAARANRSKVSRACDQCRRKKIRCDATSESDTSACTACKKTNLICQFSRQPQKRGPSKGYIKELADKVELLEGEKLALGLPPGHGLQPSTPGHVSQDASFLLGIEAYPAPTNGKKRTHAQASGQPSNQYSATRNGFSPEQHLINLDEGLFKKYVDFVHMTLPILPRDASYVRTAILDSAHPTQEALLAVFHTTMNGAHYRGSHDSDDEANWKHAWQQYSTSNWMDPSNFLQLQALLFFVIESSNRGALVINGGHGSFPWEYLNQAVSKCKSIQNLDFAYLPNLPGGEMNMAYRTARSTLTSMMILDAFLAFGNKKHGSNMEYGFMKFGEKDLEVLGQRTYRLARMAFILHRLASIRIINSENDYIPQAPARNGPDPNKMIKVNADNTTLMETLKEYAVENLRAFLPPADPILQLAFWYTYLQIEIHYYPLATAKKLLYPCKRIIDFLTELAQTKGTSNMSPLFYHFTGLTAYVLFQLCECENTKSEAGNLLEGLDHGLQILVPASDSSSFDAGIRDAVARKRAMLVAPLAGLEELADAAVTADINGSGSSAGFTRKGSSGSNEDALQAAAEAAAKAAQAHMLASSNVFRGQMLSQDGYLTGLLVHEL